jgi:hypothetical protein
LFSPARGDKRIPPHPDPLPRGGEGRKKMKRFKQCPLTLALSRGVERGLVKVKLGIGEF